MKSTLCGGIDFRPPKTRSARLVPLRPNTDGIPAVAGSVAGKQMAGHGQSIADKLPERPAYVRGAIVEM